MNLIYKLAEISECKQSVWLQPVVSVGVLFVMRYVCRNKTISLERLKRSIVNEVRSGDQEGRCLAQYKREMELLQQEKMSHVEELRQIHADINAVSA